MLVRKEGDDAVLITQPAHAWLSGVLAAAWGGDDFSVPEPRAAIRCATSLHDIGWLDWEEHPELDADTGLPREFLKVRAERHTALWRRGIAHAAAYGPWVALLVSRHGIAIYDRTFDPAQADPSAAEAVARFRNEQGAFQAKLCDRLLTAPTGALTPSDHRLDCATRLIVAVDTISLHLCWDTAAAVEIGDAPDASGAAVALTLRRTAPGVFTVEPWPFATPVLDLVVPARRLRTRCHSADDLQAALAEAIFIDIPVRIARDP